ncbi:MAG: (deoxy)nucleoside triphosphate pyrophosphohydrolase [Candidatus Thermoplasmatota archaeon]|nr:(deoxy)nucleoside triphosphate pyrophosphohydrolase [Candidatus Thermoplasmatota archaeon]
MRKRPLLVTAALILGEDRILIARRLPDSRFEPNKWEFPGGKVDLGEHPERSLQRELQEELGVDAEVGPLYDLASHVYDQKGLKRHVVILFYLCRISSGEPRPMECQDLRWVTREELSRYIYVEGDEPVVAKIRHDDDLWSRT